MFRSIIAGLIGALAFCGISFAQTCPAYTYTLTNGTTADANQVMANFNTIATCANGLPALTANQVWTASQRVNVQTVPLVSAAFTPNFDTGADFNINLTSGCPCAFANPSTTPVPGQHGVIYFNEDATGGRTIGSWGSSYVATGGTATLAFSGAANAINVFSYVVKDSTHIVLTAAATNVVH